jgi:predicted RNA-binding protein YlxR (DUF448 family)
MRPSYEGSTKREWRVLSLISLVVLLAGGYGWAFAAQPQSEIDVPPDATPQVKSVKPAAGAPGEEVTVVVEGANFSRSVYVSFSEPTVHAAAIRRINANQLEAQVQIGKKAQPRPIILYVSNTASAVAQATFTITGEAKPQPGTEEPKAPSVGPPEVNSLDPPQVTVGSQTGVKVTGKDFAPGVKVAFSNPGIHVQRTDYASPTELTTYIQVAPDASLGQTSLSIVNPDDRKAEAALEVVSGSPAAPAQPAKVSPAAGPAGGAIQRFEVYNLGEGTAIFQTLNKPKGTLSVAGGKLRYEEGGQEVFSAAPADIKEMDVTSIAGISTGTFHVTLNSGKTYNFVPTSLRPADSQAFVESLRRALQ